MSLILKCQPNRTSMIQTTNSNIGKENQEAKQKMKKKKGMVEGGVYNTLVTTQIVPNFAQIFRQCR